MATLCFPLPQEGKPLRFSSLAAATPRSPLQTPNPKTPTRARALRSPTTPKHPSAAVLMAPSASIPFQDAVVLHAAVDGDLPLLKRMASKVNLEEVKDAKRQGVLLFATSNGHLELCKYLVEELGFNVNCTCAGRSPVHVAAGQGQETVLRYLLSHGGDTRVLDSEGTSLLHFAVMGGNCEAVSLLLSMGVDVDPPNYRGTPLLVAAGKDRVQVVKILLEHGADPNKIVGHVYSSLMVACLGGSLKSMRLLVKAGADVNFVDPSGRSILTEATVNGSIDIVKFLLEAGADPNIGDKDGVIPIMHAATVTGQRELVEILFPKTRPVLCVLDWSVDGIITKAKDLLLKAQDAAVLEEWIADVKSQGKEAFAKGDYPAAVYFYSRAMDKDPSDATLFANRSLCYLRLREGDRALSDARQCILMRPHWSKAWYRKGAALSFLKAYKGAVAAFKQALKLDPASDETKKALRVAIAGMGAAAAKHRARDP